MNTLICCGAAAALLSFATATAHAAATSATGTVLGPIDSYFVTQTSLGTPFQVAVLTVMWELTIRSA